ncbi:MAG: hypothetical protein DI530_09420, partial [Sphingomonas sp.]|uniref:hypothetical protein n=1 Tax=Sphingomonas sp. TaxID=28214 RepID=UPI000DBC1E1E
IRTARVRTSGENLFVVLLVIDPSSQELGPPTNPGRFNLLIRQPKQVAHSGLLAEPESDRNAHINGS